MLVDELTEFCDETAMDTGGTGRVQIGDIIDLSVARDIGAGRTMYLCIQATEAFTSAGGTATIAFRLVSDPTTTLDDNSTIHIQTATVDAADCTVGYQWIAPLPPEASAPYERYLGILQAPAVEALTGGAVNAFLTMDPPTNWQAYADVSS